jgi:hypothetical protein
MFAVIARSDCRRRLVSSLGRPRDGDLADSLLGDETHVIARLRETTRFNFAKWPD